MVARFMVGKIRVYVVGGVETNFDNGGWLDLIELSTRERNKKSISRPRR